MSLLRKLPGAPLGEWEAGEWEAGEWEAGEREAGEREAGEWEDVPADKVLAGAPRTRTTMLYENPAEKLYAGEWEATAGKWRIAYAEWEYVQVISGACVLAGDDGSILEAGPGDKFVIEPGFTGSWEVLASMRKSWVIRE